MTRDEWNRRDQSQRDVALFGPDGTGIATTIGASVQPSRRDEDDYVPIGAALLKLAALDAQEE